MTTYVNGREVQAAPQGTMTTLFRLIGADLNSTADQAFVKVADFTSYNIKEIVSRNASGSIVNAVGGIYTGAGKTGTIIVAAAQAYGILTASDVFANQTVTAAGQRTLNLTALFLSLTTPMGSAGTCDVHIEGYAW